MLNSDLEATAQVALVRMTGVSDTAGQTSL